MIKKLSILPLFSLLVFGQCSQQSGLRTTGTGPVINNLTVGCVYFSLTYSTNASAISIQVEGSTNGGVSYTAFGTLVTGTANPDTTVPADAILVANYYPLVRVNVTTLTGSSVNVSWNLTGINYLNAATITGTNKVQVHNVATQAITAAIATGLTFDTNDYDPNGMHSTSVNPTRFTIPLSQAGAWLFGCQTEFPLLTATIQFLQYYINGAATKYTSSNLTNASYPTYPHLEWVLNLNAGDYVECYIFIEGATGATLPTNGSAMVATKL